jgi:hypothetical protein
MAATEYLWIRVKQQRIPQLAKDLKRHATLLHAVKSDSNTHKVAIFRTHVRLSIPNNKLGASEVTIYGL